MRSAPTPTAWPRPPADLRAHVYQPPDDRPMSSVRWAGLAAILGGLAWIPIRLAISGTYSDELVGLTYVEWNRLMLLPLLAMLVAAVLLATGVRGALPRVGAWAAAIGLLGMLAGVVVEFYVAGGLAGDREGAILGWMIYLLPGLLVHTVGLLLFSLGALSFAGAPRGVGVVAGVIGLLHLAWLPAGVHPVALAGDQVLIGVGWVAMGALLLRAGADRRAVAAR